MQTELHVQAGVQEKILPYDEIMPKRKKNTVRLEACGDGQMMRALLRNSTNLQGKTTLGQSNMVILPHRISEKCCVSHQDELKMVTKCSPKRHLAYTRFHPQVELKMQRVFHCLHRTDDGSNIFLFRMFIFRIGRCSMLLLMHVNMHGITSQ
jgi:hypothetical protein